LWLRYDFAVPTKLHGGGTASLEAVYVDRDGTKIALKKDFDMGVYEVMHAEDFIRIGDAGFSLAGCSGEIVGDKDTLRWELGFEDPVVSLRLYPYSFLYSGSFPRTKYCAPRLLGFVTGTVFVNHRKITLFRSRVHQGHIYGTALAHTWAWANCTEFREDSEAYFEALTARVPVGGKPLRPLSLFCIGMEGRQFCSNSILKMFWWNKSHPDFDGWRGEFEKGGFRFEFSIKRDSNETVGVAYHGPNGETRYCYNNLMADIEIKVKKRRRGFWQDYKFMTARGKCAYETVSPEMNASLPMIEK
jgi:hypothetical protein